MENSLHNLILVFLCLISQSSCKSTSSETVILVDQTEKYFTHLSLDEYKTVSTLKDNKFNGEELRIQPITENGFNEVICIKIDRVSYSLLGNEYRRRSEIKKYYSAIDSALNLLKEGRQSRSGSVIFKNLSKELNRLSESKANSKSLIINSDLMENSFIDFTITENIERIRGNPKEIEKILTDRYPLNNLKGICIYIKYIPASKRDSERFEIVSDFYRKLLESYGAEVKISGNLF